MTDKPEPGTEPVKVWYPSKYSLWPVPDEKPVPIPKFSRVDLFVLILVNVIVVSGIVAAIWYAAAR